MKKLVALLFLLSTYYCKAQKNIDGLINAERNFAAHSVQKGTKDAFLKFLDSNGIVFEQGKAVNGKLIWAKREDRRSVLNWFPEFAEISLSNDFGYTTGPWELRGGATKDSVIARGQYTTVWHIDIDGEWKFLVDLGVGNSPKRMALSLTKITAKKLQGTTETTDLLEAEQKFIEAFKKNKGQAYRTHLSDNSILNRNGLHYPATSGKAQADRINDTPGDLRFSILGYGISPGRDLGYVYGNTLINNRPENYLRIWRREKSGWKIALEVVRY